METVEIDGKEYEISGRDHMGIPIIKGQATTVHHKDENGNQIFDEDGNPKVSVHISVSPTETPIVGGNE